jgi:hypothetical protein
MGAALGFSMNIFFNLVAVVGLLSSFVALFLWHGKGMDAYLYLISLFFFILLLVSVFKNKKIFSLDALLFFRGDDD